MWTRVATAAIALPLLGALTAYGGARVFAGLIALIALLGFHELVVLARAHGIEPFRGLGMMLAAVLAAAPLYPGSTGPLVAACTLAVLIRALAVPDLSRAMAAVGVTLLGVLWLGLLGSYLTALWLDDPRLVYTLLLAVWGGDTAAYLVGRAIGRHKLAPRISPGKTIEGAVGSVFGCVGGLALGCAMFDLSLAPAQVVGLGLALTVVAVLGDLAESLLKRGAGRKDSGGLLPGHGGILDRMDSLLFAAPVMYHGFIALHLP